MKRTRTYLPATTMALTMLGLEVAAARRELGWTAADLAGRLGVSLPTVARVESGAPGTAIGTVLEAAVVCGVPLFGVDAADRSTLARLTDVERSRLALLPGRIRRKAVHVDDDF